MTKDYGIFDYELDGGGNPDREYPAAHLRAVGAKLYRNGLILGEGDEFEVVESDPVAMTVEVGTGTAIIQGGYYTNDETETLTIDTADPTYDRIDRIVLRLSAVTGRNIDTAILTGTPAGTPEAPGLTRTDEVYEISIAQIYVGAGVTSISDTNITDERSDSALCGHAAPKNLPDPVDDGDPVSYSFFLMNNIGTIDNDGNFWLVQNAIYDPDTDTWSQPDTTKVSNAITLDSSGHYLLSCAAGNPQIEWTNAFSWDSLVFPDGYINAKGMDLKNVNKITCQYYSGAFVGSASDNIRVSSEEYLEQIYPNKGDVIYPFSVVIPDIYASGTVMRIRTDCETRSDGSGGAAVWMYLDGVPYQQIKRSESGSGTNSRSVYIDNRGVLPGAVYTFVCRIDTNSTAYQHAKIWGVEVCCDDEELKLDSGFDWDPWQT